MKVVFNHDPLRFCPTFDDLYLERPSIWLVVAWKKEWETKEKGWTVGGGELESETWTLENGQAL